LLNGDVDAGKPRNSPWALRSCVNLSFIRLVSPHEGSPSAEPSGSSRCNPVGPSSTAMTAPFAPRALPRFITTTRQSAPLRRIGTFSLAVGAACAFPWHRRPGSHVPYKACRASALPNAGCRSVSIRTSTMIPEDGSAPGFDTT
jgi:hypothetical protein